MKNLPSFRILGVLTLALVIPLSACAALPVIAPADPFENGTQNPTQPFVTELDVFNTAVIQQAGGAVSAVTSFVGLIGVLNITAHADSTLSDAEWELLLQAIFLSLPGSIENVEINVSTGGQEGNFRYASVGQPAGLYELPPENTRDDKYLLLSKAWLNERFVVVEESHVVDDTTEGISSD